MFAVIAVATAAVAVSFGGSAAVSVTVAGVEGCGATGVVVVA